MNSLPVWDGRRRTKRRETKIKNQQKGNHCGRPNTGTGLEKPVLPSRMAKAGNQGKRKSVAGTTKESREDQSDSQRNVAEGKLEPEPEMVNGVDQRESGRPVEGT